MWRENGQMKRYLYAEIADLALARKKMAFISGPRQVGKTTLAKSFISDYQQSKYQNWDESSFRKKWAKSYNQSIESEFRLERVKERKLLILDEIHKSKGWKQKVKGLYDQFGDELNLIVTGSARLNIFKRGGDSLLGRFLNFRLHPLSLGELVRLDSKNLILSPDAFFKSIFKQPTDGDVRTELDDLMRFGGFPEPFLAKSEKVARIWRQGRSEKLVREDLRDLTRIVELSQVETLMSLLPSKVGSPLSVQSLREDLEVSHDTVSRWLRYLEELYYFFELAPWSKSMPRSLKKEKKIYLYDWSENESEGQIFENLVASHLLKACHFWTDTGEGNFQLHYLRNKEKEEVDFLLSRNKKPWLMVETKSSSSSIDRKIVDKFSKYFKCPYVQIVLEKEIWRHSDNCTLISAEYFLKNLP
jgi:uncharacterized protein